MDRLKIFLVILLNLFIGPTFFLPVLAQETDIVITPNEALLDVGETMKFDVFAFSANSTPVKINSVSWSVSPDSMGTITEDGFFIAGRHVGKIEIKVTVVIGDRTIVKVVFVSIGRLINHFFDVLVVPEKAVVPMGTEQQFEVVVKKPDGTQVRPKHVRWHVEPEGLGKIDENGLFIAGEEVIQGKVIALVEIDGLILRGAAKVTVSPPPSAAISGMVTNNTATAIEGAHVKAVRLGRIHWVQRAETGINGEYFIGDLIPGIYVLYANAKGYIGEFYDNTRKFLEATPLSVAENETLTDKDFVLSEGGTIKGTVMAAAEGPPLANAHVMAILVVNPRIAHHTRTNNDGSYEIDALPTGTYAVRANAPGYQAEYYQNMETLLEADRISLTEPEVVSGVNFDLVTASAIRGVVKSADGSPIAGAKIRIFSPTDAVTDFRHFVLKETRTNKNGEYIAQVGLGVYLVHASAAGFNGEFFDDKGDIAFADPVQVFPDEHTTGIDFILAPLGSISGIVKNGSNSEPIEDAVVQAFPENALTTAGAESNLDGFRAKTGPDGNYTIENVPAGTYIVRAVAEGYLPEFFDGVESHHDATPVHVGDNQNANMIDFTLVRGGSISGIVTSSSNDVKIPIEGALVRVFHADSRHHRRTYTAADGTYKVQGLRPGSYYVHVIAEGFFAEFYDNVRNREDATPVDVVAQGESPGIDFDLTPFAEIKGTIAGRVVSDHEKSHIFGAVVIAVSRNTLFPHITFTGPHGYYRITNLDPDKYFVFAWAPGFVGKFYDDAKIFQEADRVFVEANQVTHGINFGLSPRIRQGVYSIRGRISSTTTGEPLKDVLVQARFADNVEVNAVTNADGNYVISDVSAGSYKIEATGVGYALVSAANATVGDGNDAENVNLSLDVDNVTSVDLQDGVAAIPDRYDLLQNFPNPFNPETTIKYQLSETSQVTLKILNILGQEIRTLLDKKQEAAVYSVKWDGKDKYGRQMASGIYIFQLKAGDNFKMSRRMLLLK